MKNFLGNALLMVIFLSILSCDSVGVKLDPEDIKKVDEFSGELKRLNNNIEDLKKSFDAKKVETSLLELSASVKEMWSFFKSFDNPATRVMFGARPR